jgi:hypothetical protein
LFAGVGHRIGVEHALGEHHLCQAVAPHRGADRRGCDRNRCGRGLAEADIPLPGHIVAQIALVGATTARGTDGTSRARLRFDALTIED